MNLHQMITLYVDAVNGKEFNVKRSKVIAFLSLWTATSLFMWCYVLFTLESFGTGPVYYCGLAFSVLHSLSPIILYYCKSMAMTGLLMSFTGIGFQTVFCLYSGGLDSPAAIWLSLHPVLLSFFVSQTVIGLSVVVNATIVIGLAFLSYSGSLPENTLPTANRIPMSVTSCIGLDVLITLFTIATIRLAERKNKIIKSNKDLIEDLLRILSHDIKTPLAIASSLSEDLEQNRRHTKGGLRKIRRLHKQIRQIIDSTHNWMENQDETFSMRNEIIPIGEIRSHVFATFDEEAKKRNIALRISIPEHKWSNIVGDRHVIFHQIFNNVISNALKFTPKDGWIEILTHCHNDQHIFKIRNSGRGISARKRRRLLSGGALDRLSGSILERRSGFGLPIISLFMTKMNGTIEVDDIHDHGTILGTEVILKFPARNLDECDRDLRGPSVDSESVSDSAFRQNSIALKDQEFDRRRSVLPLAGKRVLLVDDRRDIQAEVGSYLRKNGAMVECVGNGYAALDCVNNSCQYSAVIMDLLLPGLNGIETCRQMRSLTQRPEKIIAFTGTDKSEKNFRDHIGLFDRIVQKTNFKAELVEQII